MSNVKRYKAKIDTTFDDFEIIVEIDHDVMTDESLNLINSFWSGMDERMADADGDIIKAVVTHLCNVCFWLARKSEFGNVVNMFKKGLYTEGWPYMDGSTGIKLVEVSNITWPKVRNVEFSEVLA